MNKKKLLLISIPVVLGGVLLYFLTRGKGKGKQKEKEQEGGGGTQNTTTSTSKGSKALNNEFRITKLCGQIMKDTKYTDTLVPNDWDLYVVSLKNKNSVSKLRIFSSADNKSEIMDDSVVFPDPKKKGAYITYYHYPNDEPNNTLKNGEVIVASKGLSNNQFRGVYLRKGLDKNYNILNYQECEWKPNEKELDNGNKVDITNYLFIDKSVVKPLKDIDPARYQQELQLIKNQIANRKNIG